MFQNEYRQQNENQSFIADFSLTRGYKSSTSKEKNSISHFFLNYKKNLELSNFTNSKLETKIEKVTNDTYLKVFQNNLFETPVLPADKDLMESKLHVELENDSFTFNSGMRLYENLSGKNNNQSEYLAPNFTLLDTEGNNVSLSDYKGKVVIINFWSII